MKRSIFPDGETFLLCGAFEPHLGWDGMEWDADELPHLSASINDPKGQASKENPSGGICSMNPTVKSGIPLMHWQHARSNQLFPQMTSVVVPTWCQA